MLQLLPCSVEAVCCSVTTKELEDPVMTAHRESVLQEFQEVFETPTELPPFRGIHDHQIVLKEGSNPVSLRPYRYPPAQKDIIDVYNPSLEAHADHLRQVFQILKAHTFYVKKSKCAFFTTRIKYLGHFITPTGVTTDPIKVQVVRAWPAPQTVKQLRGFLGLTGYYRRFIKGYSIIASPLTDLLKRDSFHWPEEAHTAFTTLKDALSNSPVLAIPDIQKPFVVETDASSTGIGVVLMQDRHPVAFISKVLSPKNRLLSVYDRELLALVHAVSKWHQYLSLNIFTILTDQHSLKYLLEQRLSTPAQYRRVTKLMGLSYEILHNKGKDNVAADALSRASHGEVLQLTVSSISFELWDSLLKSYEHDSALQGLKLQVLSNPSLHPHFSILDNLLYRKQKLVIPNDGQVRLVILQWLHSSHQGGHSGIRASIARIKSMFYWKGLAKDVTKFIQQCETCLRCKYEPRAVAGLLQPLPVPEGVWQSIAMDFIEKLPKSHVLASELLGIKVINVQFIALYIFSFTKKSITTVIKSYFTMLHVALKNLAPYPSILGAFKSPMSFRACIISSSVTSSIRRLSCS
ncbi:hypothetical protein KIW84_053460 [Lathyrus oleraceus]|uniref:Uncharacterized protein n=1 Tax=Pisum sativum TaxID=3888 RepID=A0A9D4WUU2_PEA|nr:hypothetical protein KIW84_053460 [Pisum sativum]